MNASVSLRDYAELEQEETEQTEKEHSLISSQRGIKKSTARPMARGLVQTDTVSGEMSLSLKGDEPSSPQ